MTAAAAVRRYLSAAKLHPPQASTDQVARRSIADLVCSARATKVILVHAPAGFGKSTTMLQWRQRLEAQAVATAWLNLDRADNDISRFLHGLEAAVAAIARDDGDSQESSELERNRTIGDRALQVISRLLDRPTQFSLFLDDFESISESGVLSLLREIIDHLPLGGQLIIGSRTFPDLRLGRLRASNQLLEIDAAELRFSREETAEFLAARGLLLTADDLSRLHEKTEGWAVALRLAAVALERSDSRSNFIARFSGSSGSVADYLTDDVLAHQPAHVRDFLLRTSILRSLDAPLCDALLQRGDSARVLREVAAANLLLLPMGGERPTYRYHSLFAGFLQSQLAKEAAAEVPRLHGAASRWYEAQARPVQAIEHAIEGGDIARAVRLIEANGVDLLAGDRMRLLSRWFDALPAEVVSASPRLQVIQLWASAFTHGPRATMAMLASSGLHALADPVVEAHVAALHPLLLALMDRYEEAYAVGRKSLAARNKAVPFADTVLDNVMASIVSVMGDHREAQRLLDAARSGQGVTASAFNLMYSEVNEGILDLREGRLRQAAARFRIAVSATHDDAYSLTDGNAWAGMLYATIVYEANDLEQASRLLQVYLPLARDGGLPDQVIHGYVMLSRIAFWRGDVDQAFQLLTNLEYLGHERQLPRLVTAAKLERSRLQLLQGYPEAARDELARAQDPALRQQGEGLYLTGNDTLYLALVQLRLEARAGDAQQAALRLAEEIHKASRESRHRRALSLRLLRCIALQRNGEAALAQSELKALLKVCCSEGFMRLILDEGAPAAVIVGELKAATAKTSGVQSDPVFAEYLQRLWLGFGAATELSKPDAAPAALLAPLTRTEIKVLRLLAEGYSNNAMAEKLFVSDSTVRTHLRNISGKLDTHSRTQAVAAARRLGVIR